MLFTQGDKNEDKTKVKKQSTLGFLFNPNFGSDMRPTKQAIGLFARMIAMVFVSFRLFPKEHPAFRDDTVALPLRDVITIAWGQLSFTRQGLPQVVAFAAVVGALVFSALFVVTLLGSLLVGSAHAQSTSGMFSPVDGGSDCDLVTRWLDYLFLGRDTLASSCSLDGAQILVAPSGSGMQKAFAAGLNFFSKGILVCAGFMLLYHLLIIIGDSAYSGKPFGRANALWAPIRLVVAIGLLVPVSTSGLNLGQHMVVQVAKWGSGLASQTWDLAVKTALSAGDTGGIDMRIPPPPDVVGLVNNLIMIKACETGFNKVLQNTYGAGQEDILAEYEVKRADNTIDCPGSSPIGLRDSVDFNTGEVIKYGESDYPKCTQSRFSSANRSIYCGDVRTVEPSTSWPGAYAVNTQVQRVVETLRAGHNQVVQEMLNSNSIAEAASSVMAFMSATYNSGSNGSIRAKISSIDTVEKAIGNRNAAVDEYLKKLDAVYRSAAKLKVDSRGVDEWTKHGWVMAGAWYNTIARAQAAVYTGADAGVPATTSALKENDINIARVDFIDRVASLWGGQTGANRVSSSTETVSIALKDLHNLVLVKPYKPAKMINGMPESGSANAEQMPDSAAFPLKLFFEAIDGFGRYAGLWGASDGTGKQFGKTANPLAELSFFGYANVQTGMNILAWAGAGSIAGSVLSELGIKPLDTIGKVVGSVAAIAFFVAGLFIAGGMMLAFMLPLIPFIKFFYNVLTWLIIVFECVVAMPLFALAHLSPYGDGFPGQAAQGYKFLLSLLIRPVLLVVGLIAGFLLFFVSINFLNTTYSIASAGTGATGGSLAVLSKMFYTIFYIVTAYVCAHKSFQTISYFPAQAMNWFGGGNLAGKDMGDKGETMGALKLATGYMGIQAAEKMLGAGKDLGSAFSKPLADKRNKAKADTKDKNQEALAFANRQSEAEHRGQLLTRDADTKEEYWANLGESSELPAGHAAWQGQSSQLPADHPVLTDKTETAEKTAGKAGEKAGGKAGEKAGRDAAKAEMKNASQSPFEGASATLGPKEWDGQTPQGTTRWVNRDAPHDEGKGPKKM